MVTPGVLASIRNAEMPSVARFTRSSCSNNQLVGNMAVNDELFRRTKRNHRRQGSPTLIYLPVVMIGFVYRQCQQ